MFVTESRYGNGFCQPGEILRQAGTERDPPGAAAARPARISPQPLAGPGMGKLGLGAATGSSGAGNGKCIQGFGSIAHAGFSPLWVQLPPLQPLPWLCAARWGSHGWALARLGAEGRWHRCPQRSWQHRWPSLPCRPRRWPRLSPRVASPLINRLRVASVTIETGAVLSKQGLY